MRRAGPQADAGIEQQSWPPVGRRRRGSLGEAHPPDTLEIAAIPAVRGGQVPPRRPTLSADLEPNLHDADVKALLRLAVVYNIPIACNCATADFMISSPLMHERYERRVRDDEAVIGDRTPPASQH